MNSTSDRLSPLGGILWFSQTRQTLWSLLGLEALCWREVKVKVKVQVYSLVSSVKRCSPNFTEFPPGHMTYSFISHLNLLGSIQPSCHFRCTELFKHTSLHCATRYPLTPESGECTCEQSALPRSTTSEYIQSSWGSKPQSLACMWCMLPLSHDAPLW